MLPQNTNPSSELMNDSELKFSKSDFILYLKNVISLFSTL